MFPPLPAGGFFQAQFDLPEPLVPTFAGGNWTIDGVNVGFITQNDVSVTPAPGGAVIVAAGCIVASRRRRAA